MSADLVDFIYEAAVAPAKWPSVFERLGSRFGARGGLIFTNGEGGTTWTGGGEAVEVMTDFLASGWMAQNDRIPRMVAERYPGFVTDLDLYTSDQVQTLPMYTEFLIPRGVFAGAATIVSGLGGDDLCISVEGFPSHEASQAARPALDALRPHLARAGIMATRMAIEHARAAVAAMDMIGTPAAIVGPAGRLRAANKLFEMELGGSVLDYNDRLELGDREASRQFTEVMIRIGYGLPDGRSIAVRSGLNAGPRVLHVLPMRGVAFDIFPNSSALLVMTGEAPRADLAEGLLGALFDLSPAEARVARMIARGESVANTASLGGVSELTVRTQLKSIFAKVGVSRQAELVPLLRDLALPARPTPDR